MDGFEDNTGVVVMAATNRPAALDSALTRPGRFDRIIHLPLPNVDVSIAGLWHYAASHGSGCKLCAVYCQTISLCNFALGFNFSSMSKTCTCQQACTADS